MGMAVFVRVAVRVMVVVMVMIVMMTVFEMDVELGAADLRFLAAGNVEVVAVELQLAEFAFELREVHAQVEQRANEHVAADAAKDVEIKCFHEAASWLIWLAA